MADTLWSDISEFQVPVDDSYPYQVLCIRSNDGTYLDNHFAENYAWAQRALDSGKLQVLIVYLVYRQDWQADLAALKSRFGGQPHPGTAFMLDVESWGGQIWGDNSDSINRLYWGVTDWLGTSSETGTRRVVGYGNVWDLNSLWPTKPDGVRLVVAAYGANPSYPGKLAHQFTDGQSGGPIRVPPFGYDDVDSADGYDIAALKSALGLGPLTPLAAPAAPAAAAPPAPTAPQLPGGPMTLTQSDVDAVAAAVVPAVCKYVADMTVGFNGPIGHDVKRACVQFGLAQDDAGYGDVPGWPQLGKNADGSQRSLVDAVAALLSAAGLAEPVASPTAAAPSGAAPTTAAAPAAPAAAQSGGQQQ